MTISATTQGLRPGVTTSSNRPASPFEGQMIYETDTDLTYVYGGSAWQQVAGGTAVGNSGLVYITSATIGTGVATATISNCFSSTYDDYKIRFSRIGNSSSSTDLSLQLTSITGAVYVFAGYYQLTGVAGINTFATTTTTLPLGSLNGTLSNSAICELSSPNLATAKTAIVDTSSNYLTSRVGVHVGSTVQATGFTISLTGTMTGGTITVYGYRKA